MTEAAALRGGLEHATAGVGPGAWIVPGWSAGERPPPVAPAPPRGTQPAAPSRPTADAAAGPAHVRTSSAAHGIRWLHEGSVPHREAARACRRRALMLWPRLDPLRLARTGGDPWRIARLVAERSPRPLEEIVAMLTRAAPACPVRPPRSNRPARRSRGVLRVVPAMS